MPTSHLFPIQWGYKPQRRQQALLWLSILGAICGLTILQDYLQAQRNGYGFYLSESALFKVSWLLFMPVAGLLLPFGGKRASAKLPHTLHTVAFVSMATVLHILLFAAAVSGLSALLFDHTYTPGKLISYTVSEDLYKYILVYTALALTALPRRSATAQPAPESPATAPTLAAIIVANGTQQTVLPTDSIHFITAASPYIAIHTAHKKYLHTCTLKTIEGQLDGQVFVRIHKSSIVNLRQVAHCRSRLNGDYDLVLHNGQQLRLSRHYVAAFRQRFGNG